MKQNTIGAVILVTFAFLAFSSTEGRAGDYSRQLAHDPYGGGGSSGNYSYEKPKTPEELRLEHLQRARKYERQAEKQIEKGQRKADEYRAEAAKLMAQAQEDAEAEPDDAERILEQARQKAERLEKKADDALKKSLLKAEKYNAKAEEFYEKAENT